MQINGVAHTFITAGNFAAAREFYGKLLPFLGMTIVAEGVETDAQRDILAEAGVTALQGFLLSYPLPETELETWLATHY